LVIPRHSGGDAATARPKKPKKRATLQKWLDRGETTKELDHASALNIIENLKKAYERLGDDEPKI
jgi:hypothetical protein